jgi:hypothetical protein
VTFAGPHIITSKKMGPLTLQLILNILVKDAERLRSEDVFVSPVCLHYMLLRDIERLPDNECNFQVVLICGSRRY